jgi:hypothetical protein
MTHRSIQLDTAISPTVEESEMQTRDLLAEFSATKFENVGPFQREVPDMDRRLAALKEYLRLTYGPPRQSSVTVELTVAEAINAGWLP